MEEHLTKVMLRIFNNWTGFKMAVDHSMAGPDSKKVALDFVNYMIQYCLYTNDLDREQIQNALEDILDEEFQTVCEDDSTRQIAAVLWKIVCLLREGKIAEYQEEFEKLPVLTAEWLNVTQPTPLRTSSQRESSVSDLDQSDQQPEPMDDDGWVQVTRKKAK